MILQKITIVTILYKPQKIFFSAYAELLRCGVSLDIWCNSKVPKHVAEKLLILEENGARINRHFQNIGIQKVLNQSLLNTFSS